VGVAEAGGGERRHLSLRRLRPAGIAALLAVFGVAAVVDMGVWISDLWAGRAGSDFAGYYVAAMVGRARGWPALYDANVYPQALQALRGSGTVYGNLPLAAWAALPFTALPFHVADVLWSLLLAAALVWTWRAATKGPEWERAFLLLAALAAFPVLFAIHLGQLVLLVAALVVLHWLLLRAGHPVWAGVVLGLAFVKPQDVALLPLVLLLSGRWKAAAACCATVAVMAAAVLLALGPDGLRACESTLRTLSVTQTCEFCTRHTLGGHLPSWVPQLPVRGAVALIALGPAPAAGARRYERALAAGVLGALLVTPYLNAEDLTLLFVCAWLLLSVGAPRWMRLGMLVSYPFVAYENVIGPIPLLLVELAWLAALAWDGLGIAHPSPWRGRWPARAVGGSADNAMAPPRV
jgi:alpha-1,2-mannosyltransferase